jgi:predicted kinase
MALLVVFAGLPGSGKSVLARGVADAIGATYLRIDTIESAIVSTLMP